MRSGTEDASRFRDATAQSAAGSWRARVGIIDAVAITLVVIVAFCYLLAQDAPPYLFAVLLVADTCILYLQWLLKMRNTAELVKIVSHDCDPAKLVKVIDMIEPALHNKLARMSFHAIYAVCCAQMGYDDIALEWADHIDAEKPRDPQLRLSTVSARTAVAKHRNDAGTLQMMRSHAEAIGSSAGRNAEIANAAEALEASIDRKLALMAGDYARVRELNDVIARYAFTPQAKVSNEYDRAELEAAVGDTAAAFPHYSYAAEHGGTLVIRRWAEEWLASHSLAG